MPPFGTVGDSLQRGVRKLRPQVGKLIGHPRGQQAHAAPGGAGRCKAACVIRPLLARDADATRVDIDVRNATALTLRTAGVAPTYWRLGGGLGYGGGEAPALATEPVRASFCDGAAWADAALV